MISLGLALGAGLAASTLANAESVFWVVSLAPLATTRLDPIVSPGKTSAHVHSFVGASGLSPELSFDTLQDSQCTTANVGADKSNYWVPQLYRKQAGGGLALMPLTYTNVYYQLRRQPQEPVYEFPPGFRMVAGNPARSTYDSSDNRQAAINYACLNFNGGGGPETNGFPDRRCPNDLRAQVRFPSCWDGEHAWLPGGAHMAYGAGAHDGGGKCPDTHPYRTMSLFYEYHFKDDFPYEEGARVWATGDTTGYSFHGDFFNGWPEGLFTDIWAQGDTCDVMFGLENCPPLARTRQSNGGDCKYGGITVDEDIGRGGTIPSLPGNNPLYGAGGPSRPEGYTEQGQMVDASGSVVAGRDVPNVAIKATSRRRGIVRGDPGTPGVEQISGGGSTNPVPDTANSSSAAIQPTSPNSPVASATSSTAASTTTAAAGATTTTAAAGGNNNGGIDNNVGETDVVPVDDIVSTSTAAAPPVGTGAASTTTAASPVGTSPVSGGHGKGGKGNTCNRSSRSRKAYRA